MSEDLSEEEKSKADIGASVASSMMNASDLVSLDIDSDDEKPQHFWASFDLK